MHREGLARCTNGGSARSTFVFARAAHAALVNAVHEVPTVLMMGPACCLRQLLKKICALFIVNVDGNGVKRRLGGHCFAEHHLCRAHAGPVGHEINGVGLNGKGCLQGIEDIKGATTDGDQ